MSENRLFCLPYSKNDLATIERPNVVSAGGRWQERRRRKFACERNAFGGVPRHQRTGCFCHRLDPNPAALIAHRPPAGLRDYSRLPCNIKDDTCHTESDRENIYYINSLGRVRWQGISCANPPTAPTCLRVILLSNHLCIVVCRTRRPFTRKIWSILV